MTSAFSNLIMRLSLPGLLIGSVFVHCDLAHAATCSPLSESLKPIEQTADFITLQQRSENLKTCGFGALSEIKKEADALILEFRNLKQFDVLFTKQEYDAPTLASVSERKSKYLIALRATDASDQTNEAWKKSVASVLSEFRQDPRLQLIGKDFLLPDFSSGEEQSCTDAPACTSYGDFSVVLPPSEIKQIYNRTTPKDFELTMRIIIGHEIGHYVHDIVFSKHAAKPFREAMQAIDSERYHLLVDAISMQLNHATSSDVIKGLTLSASGAAKQGDIPHRLECWGRFKVTADLKP